MKIDIGDIVLTHTTRSKEFRYHTANDIERIVRERDGRIYYIENTDGNRFNLVTEDGIILVLERIDEGILVVTQTGKHGRVFPDQFSVPVSDYVPPG